VPSGEQAVHHQFGKQFQMGRLGQVVGINDLANRIHERLQKVDGIWR
jgi:hypothetical protein